MNLIRALHVAVIASFLISTTSVLGTVAVEIKEFQPAVVPIRSVTTLNIATAGQLNSNSTVHCRFNDMSMPAEFNGSIVFCNTPPMRQIDKAVLHLEVDGKLFKAKKQLRLHEPFKVTDITPKIAAPSEQLAIQVSGITCEKWMTFFVRFQTANGTKRTRKGICDNSTVTCYIPEFPAHALLRVGVTLSNRIVEWSPAKLRIQYPVDSIKSKLKDLQPNIKQLGAFTFKLVLRDKFENPISDPGFSGSDSPLSVQYSPSTHPKEFYFLTCEVSLMTDVADGNYRVGCHGAKHEKILIYPSINNVPVGGTASYEVTITLCHTGYRWDSSTSSCVDVNECTAGLHDCVSPAICVNTQGSYRCKCPAGWTNRGPYLCIDVNECTRNPCPSNSKCTNTQGSYKCYCNSGYSPRPPVSATWCRDINECTSGTYSCPSYSRCVNLIGSYRCDCFRCYHKYGSRCRADCRTETRSYSYSRTVYYKSYYKTKCGFLGLGRCRKSRKRSRKVYRTGYKSVSVPQRRGARCPCS